MKQRLNKMLLILLVGLGLGACAYFNQPKFGQHPEGERLERVEASPNYDRAEGVFKNQLETPMLAEGHSTVSVTLKTIFGSKERPAPAEPVPAVKTDLKSLDPDQNILVWFGHSSFYMRLGGKSFLVDPVFSPFASPWSFINKAFDGTNIYSAEDMPEIDYLIITHDHWDHLDYPSVVALEPKVGRVVCPLGVGAHLEPWGYAKDKILEADWYDEIRPGEGPEEGVSLHAVPARHFSGRLIRRNKTLWAGFAVESGGKRVLFGGDSGYGPHYAEAGERFAGFDLVILENGQYDERWPYIHMLPEETAQAAEDLKGAALLPAHSGRFCISNHTWDEPFQRIVAASRERSYRLLTPKIGDVVNLDDPEQTFPHWWDGLE